MTEELEYVVQYCPSKVKLWVHCSTGDTVARFDSRFGMDIHTTTEEQIQGKPQCLHCTHVKPTKEDFEFFREYAKEQWGILIDENKIEI